MTRMVQFLYFFFFFFRTQGLTEVWEKVNSHDTDLYYLNIDGPGKYQMKSENDFGNKKFWTEFYHKVKVFRDIVEKKTIADDIVNDQKDEL